MSTSRYRVDHVITRLMGGGAQENTMLTCRGLRERSEFDVRLIHGPSRGAGDLRPWGEQWDVEMEELTSLVREIHPINDLKALIELRRLFREDPPAIVHTHSSKAGILGRWAAVLEGIPCVFHTIHGMSFHGHQSPVTRYGFRLLEQLTAWLTDEIQAVCPTMVGRAREHGLSPKQHFRTVASGMKLNQFLSVEPRGSDTYHDVRENLDLKPDSTVFMKIARLVPLKGHADLLEGFSRLEDTDSVLVLLGGGPLESDLRDRARELGISGRVRFMGQVPQEEVPEYLTASDVVIHSSHREGLARVIPQAMAAGRPPVSYALDGSPDLIRDGYNGLLIDPPNPEKITETLIGLLRTPERIDRLAERARQTVLPDYDWRVMADSVAHSYRTALPGAA